MGFSALATITYVENLSDNDLLATCEATDNLAQSGFCLGYVNGVIEGMKWGIAAPLLMAGQTAAEAEDSTGMLLGFCNPEGVTLGQFVDVIGCCQKNLA
jgi:hypothetical protein